MSPDAPVYGSKIVSFLKEILARGSHKKLWMKIQTRHLGLSEPTSDAGADAWPTITRSTRF